MKRDESWKEFMDRAKKNEVSPSRQEDIDRAEEDKNNVTDRDRLLNAFQLLKNGKQISHLKFEEFVKLTSKPHDHEGNLI